MKKTLFALLFGGFLLAVPAAPAMAQSGFALKGHYLYNSSAAGAIRDQPSAFDGFGIGAELVLPFGLGVGVSAYRGRNGLEADELVGETVVLAEGNYFFRLPLRLSPYVGVHAGLDVGRRDDDASGSRFKDSRSQLGYQVGLRFQPLSFLGLDAQYRRVSHSASLDQSPSLERGQVLLGITLF